MKPLVSQLWPQFMADPDFAACFGKVVVEHALMLRARQKVIFTLQSAAPLDKGLCARLLASLQPDYEGYQLSIENHYPYAALNEEDPAGHLRGDERGRRAHQRLSRPVHAVHRG